MKKLNISFIGLFLLFFALTSCENDGIDPITPVDPGADAGDPEVVITSPLDGSTIKVLEEVSTITIKFEVEDDIEIANIEVKVDGNTVTTMNDFLDYRVVKDQVVFDNVMNGEHTVSVTATDLEGNSFTATHNFSKEPPYTPKFAGEFLYMPYDGDYVDLITLKTAEQIGTPGFTEDAFLGSKAYKGAADSYLTIPFDGSIGEEFTAAFWYKLNSDPGRAGILVAGANADDRMQGFRLFREGDGTSQTIKLNVGTGGGESWNNGGTLTPDTGDWVFITFTVTPTESVLYVNGMQLNTGTLSSPIDWTGVEKLTIGAGGETFSYWDHKYESSPIDELRFFDKALTQEEIQGLINASAETLYMPFDTGFNDLAANREVTVEGDPEIVSESVEGSGAYSGKEGAYLTLPSEGLTTQEFSASFWYNLNATPNRAGILVMGPENPENAGYPETQNNRTSGFRFFRENGAEGFQRFKLNVGDGSADTWVDGGTAADVPNDAGWIHLAFTISQTTAIVYVNGVAVKESTFSGIDWTDCDLLSIMSGAPRFTEWGHLSDQSDMDELRLYNKVLTPEEIQEMAQ